MKSKVYLVVSVLCLITTATLIMKGPNASSAGTQPGTVQDPLITKSYLDQELRKLRDELGSGTVGGGTSSSSNSNIDINGLVQSINKYVDTKFDTFETKMNQQLTTVSAPSFVVVELAPNEKLIGEEGTELILRGGSVTAISNAMGDGITDLSDGKDLKMGENVKLNHLIIVPRTDGRGVTSQTKSWVMVKGKYKVVQ